MRGLNDEEKVEDEGLTRMTSYNDRQSSRQRSTGCRRRCRSKGCFVRSLDKSIAEE